jgi:hypothetical protein
VRMATAPPAGNSTGAADWVSQTGEPTARVLLQHGRSSLGPSKPQPSESGDPLKDGGQMPSSPEASSSDGFLSPRTGTYPPAGPVLDLPSGRVADGGVTASVDGMMVDATVWHTCINKHRTRYIRHTLASYGFPHPSTGNSPRAGLVRSSIGLETPVHPDEVGSPPRIRPRPLSLTRSYFIDQRDAPTMGLATVDCCLPAARAVNSGDTTWIDAACCCNASEA